MKTLTLRYEDSDFKKLSKYKERMAKKYGKVNWEEFVMAIAASSSVSDENFKKLKGGKRNENKNQRRRK